MKSAKLIIVVCCLITAGCYSPPFQRAEMVSMEGRDPEVMVEDYRQKLPVEFETEETLMFRVFWRKFAVLGYTQANREERTFRSISLNHLGVPLFKVQGSPQGDIFKSQVARIEEFPRFGENVAADIRRVCFDVVPPGDAETQIEDDRVIFRARQGDAIMEYVFGGPDGVLLEKRHLTDGWLWNSLDWKVNYYEYQRQDGYLYARGVVLYNADYHYRLIITRRDITFDLQ